MTEILFIVEEDHEGFHAKAVGASIFTEADSREELVRNVREAVMCHYDSTAETPKVAHLHYVHDETISIASDKSTTAERAEVVKKKLFGSVLKDDDPFGPATPPEDWEAMR